MNEEKKIFLLRAFGDFIIAVYTASKSRLDIPVTLIASKHLEPLYKAIPISLPPNVDLQFHDFRVRNNIFSCFTNKFIISLHTVRELHALRGYIRKNPFPPGVYYMEKSNRVFLPRLFTGYPFQCVVSDQNVYEAYADFFRLSFDEPGKTSVDMHKHGMNILVIPDARQKKRNISDDIIKKIADAFAPGGNVITTAFFKKKMNYFTDRMEIYQNFPELIELIRNADIVIGADSMPVHIAQMLGKPHFILHPAGIKDQFFTPFSRKNKTHFTFEDIASRKSFLPNE
ncbi:MAG: hypothetical protein JWQ30_1408 [Sediminibacterium sp.]|nr:hypothetical protein [Sediminibacterium sp.]